MMVACFSLHEQIIDVALRENQDIKAERGILSSHAVNAAS